VLTHVGRNLFFVANGSPTRWELWTSDGTRIRTRRVRRVVSENGATSSWPFWLTNVGGRLFFSASDEQGDVELWKSDGARAGTGRVKDINMPGPSAKAGAQRRRLGHRPIDRNHARSSRQASSTRPRR
jgi:ELWxxDGT repeat protein